MKIEKVGVGAYRVRKMISGKSYCMTFDHKPTKKEIEEALNRRAVSSNANHVFTFEQAALQYMEIKKNVLSPVTTKNYKSILRNLSEDFCHTKIDNMSNLIVQREINDYAEGRSPKTVQNASGLISVVLGMYYPDLKLHTKLPQKKKTIYHLPSDIEVKMVLDYAKGSPYEVPLMLAVYGLRRSEILCIDSSCLSGNMLTINRAKVDSEENFVVKDTKNTSSTRTIYVDDYLASLIREMDKPFSMYPNDILRYLHTAQDTLHINRCRLHDFRHYYVTLCHDKGVPDAITAASVGHANTITTRKVYLAAKAESLVPQQQEMANFLKENLY